MKMLTTTHGVDSTSIEYYLKLVDTAKSRLEEAQITNDLAHSAYYSSLEKLASWVVYHKKISIGDELLGGIFEGEGRAGWLKIRYKTAKGKQRKSPDSVSIFDILK